MAGITNETIYKEVRQLSEEYNKRGLLIAEIKTNLDTIVPMVVKHEGILFGNNGTFPGLISQVRGLQESLAKQCTQMMELSGDIKSLGKTMKDDAEAEKVDFSFGKILKFLLSPVLTALAVALAFKLLNL